MNEQINNINKNKSNMLLFIIISILIATLIVGGFVYFLINNKSQSTVQNLNSQLSQSTQKQSELNQ